MHLSKRQNEYIKCANHRWNVKSGAVRSGKSYVDTAYVIPFRIRERAGQPGLNVILGVSKETIERNVLAPMREIYTDKLVGFINSRNVVSLFGEEAYCLGAEKVSQVAKIQGASIKYCYGDEIAKWNKEVFQMLKSRLDKPNSCFDGSCNPETPTHWLKEFIDSDVDMYLQHYTLFDNPHLPKEFVDSLCKEYEGTIYYDRLILGLWKRAEGAIYRKFADNPNQFMCKIVERYNKEDVGVQQIQKSEITSIEIGVDFGGNVSGHSFVARGYTDNYTLVVCLISKRIMAKDVEEDIDSNLLDALLCEFIGEVIENYSEHRSGYCNVEAVYWDNAETVLGNSIRNAVGKKYPWIIVRAAKKKRIKDRIDCTLRLMGARRFFLTQDCKSLELALSEAVWNQKILDRDERLDDGSSDIDTLDAMEYTIERDMKYLINEV